MKEIQEALWVLRIYPFPITSITRWFVLHLANYTFDNLHSKLPKWVQNLPNMIIIAKVSSKFAQNNENCKILLNSKHLKLLKSPPTLDEESIHII